jgi:hypothetical protein
VARIVAGIGGIPVFSFELRIQCDNLAAREWPIFPGAREGEKRETVRYSHEPGHGVFVYAAAREMEAVSCGT